MLTYRNLFPAIECYNSGQLSVGDGHVLYYEESGNPEGKPAVYLHGGPGSGSSPGQRRVFDPDKYRIILFDQRGCGRSTPTASLVNNTTWDLVRDMETLRNFLSIDRWQVCGGSWGSALALSYAETHPEKVSELVLRGIFTLRKSELNWYYQGGAAEIFPDEWEKFVQPIPVSERDDLIAAYYRQLTSADASVQRTAASAWSVWEGSTINLLQRPEQIKNFSSEAFSIAFARIECHYFINKGFFESDQFLIDNVNNIRHIPTTIIQGRYDVCTPMVTAWNLHQAFSEAAFYIVPDAGHMYDEPGIADQLVRATDRYVD